MRKLNVLERIRVKQQARTAWMEANGDPDRAEQIFRGMQPVGIDPQLLAVLISVALQLFKLWIDTRQTQPQVVMTEEEATVMGFGEND